MSGGNPFQHLFRSLMPFVFVQDVSHLEQEADVSRRDLWHLLDVLFAATRPSNKGFSGAVKKILVQDIYLFFVDVVREMTHFFNPYKEKKKGLCAAQILNHSWFSGDRKNFFIQGIVDRP